MNALTVLYGGSLAPQAFAPVLRGESAFNLALERAAAFPGSKKTVFLTQEGNIPPIPAEGVSVLQRPSWTVSELLAALSEEAAGFDFAYYAWADTPFLDSALAGRIAERHTRFAADYSYADGWPYGLGPELITGAAAGILCKIAGDDGQGPVKRDSLFAVLQKDINSFDIETEISPADLRYHRLSLAADSRRNLLLLERFAGAGCSGAEDAARIIEERPECLRTLPAFFPIQVSASCPAKAGACAFCPYPRIRRPDNGGAFLDPADFEAALAKIEGFAGDAVIDLSLWGELSLHPRREALIQSVLDRPALSLLIETSGYGWAGFGLEQLAEKAAAAQNRLNGLPALSWIVSLASSDLPAMETEAVLFVKKLASLFPREAGKDGRVYVETIRTAGAEDAVEQFYRAWKAGFPSGGGAPGVIIQKYDNFCGLLPQLEAVDLSPVERRPCWHLLRDFPVLIDGTVPFCREDINGSFEKMGNVFREEPEIIWKRGEALYFSHCRKEYEEPCKICGEYYTFNF
ncbi:MAG: spiro-SPASM protein [Spirochaetaceae bacterium]|jgi:spiro-SPASM protein|nr:spiro-SPASM protein [Spirochaetaceae bacterium]